MERANRRSMLGQRISEILGSADSSAETRTQLRATASKSVICGGVALLVIAPVQVEAVGLGEITVRSTIGQPLQAVVPIRLGKGETLPANCVQPGKSPGELSSPGNLRVQSPVISGPGTHDLRISTPGSLHEPMYELSLVINCPGTPILVRHYVFMLDLPGAVVAAPNYEVSESRVDNPRTGPLAVPAAPTNRAARSVVPTDSARSLTRSAAAIDAGTLYRVRSGDTLSTIANRIDGRLPDATWAVAGRLFATNTDAFIGHNPDLIKLGSLIQIPDTAELASILPSSTRSLVQPSAAANRAPAPAPRPSVDTKPLAAVRVDASSADAAVAKQQGGLVLESDIAPVGITGDVYEAIPAEEASGESSTINEVWAFDEEAAATAEEIADAAPQSPFVDEATANAAADTDVQPQVAADPETFATPATDSKVSPWLAIGIGLLFGLAIGALTLRRRFLTVLVNIVPSRDFIRAIAARILRTGSTGKIRAAGPGNAVDFDNRAASRVFDTSVDRPDGSDPLPIGDPMEKTYIVETADHEPTQEVGDTPLENADPSVHEIRDADEDVTELTAADKSDEDLLAEIFEEGPGEAAAGALEPTSKLPQMPEEEIFDPSGELPQQFVDEIFDPTAEVPIDPLGADQSTLMQAFTEELEQIDPEFFDAAAQIDPSAETVESERITSPANEEVSLDALPGSAEEDDEMSKTLYDALTLLESDYEDEFTASQILERSAIKKSLANLDAEEDNDDESIDEELAG